MKAIGLRAGRVSSWMLTAGTLLGLFAGAANADGLDDKVTNATKAIESKLVTWRRDIHQHPELSNREVRTGALVAKHLKALKFDEVRIDVAHTGVVGILKGGKPGPVVALRADMDALPVTEQVDLPFASKVTTQYNGETVGVMHACGHDAHTAMLMGVAEVLAGMRADIPGTVMFIFQPAEEGAPAGEEGGAALMMKQGLFKGTQKPAAVFGLHVWPVEAGTIGYRPRETMAAADDLKIVVQGRQTHGSSPWYGTDPITVAGQIVMAIQTIPSRQLDITRSPSVISIGRITGGVRGNIIPDSVEMIGTIRTFDPGVRDELLKRLDRTVTQVATSAGASAEIIHSSYAPVVFNDPALTAASLPALRRAAGDDRVLEVPLIMGSEDFAFYGKDVPSFFFFLGINKDGVKTGEAAANHSPKFYVNEAALPVGVKALSFAALDFLRGGGAQ
ncbi:amidohydrolase [Govanella unica]|uniref:Amidohydrolase n=1 Tax=Govanella unica TaxID=2975056 RepID=A0A9X3Z5U2_9PROT|nr:amidohydrolase [Govania unica]MDA5192495.1 amidohydrolase [Govania unica]